MTTPRFSALIALAAVLLILPACATQEIEYVDESGNVLAVDSNGQPILPGTTGPRAVMANGLRQAPAPGSAEEMNVRVGDTFAIPAPSGKGFDLTPPATTKSTTPADVDTPPAGAVKPTTSYPEISFPTSTRTTKRAQGPVNSSSALDAPPSGS